MSEISDIELEIYINGLRKDALENQARNCNPWSQEFDDCIEDIKQIQQRIEQLAVKLIDLRRADCKLLSAR